MTGFSAATVSPLSYDFTSFPQDADPGQRCTGKGTIPEPSKAVLESFYKQMQDGFGTAIEAGDEEAVNGREEQMFVLLAGVCSGRPSADELRQLPPRILVQFARWLMGELAPKA